MIDIGVTGGPIIALLRGPCPDGRFAAEDADFRIEPEEPVAWHVRSVFMLVFCERRVT